ncbi:MAG: spermidine/putrescine ABC transporter substrate-binding protein [Clostridia bacterium]|nr:spermidine/putrescine ABC transporter substrate-binding protein [Clostridia bacterium]
MLFAFMPASVLAASAAETSVDPESLRGTTLYVYNWGEYISDGSEGSLDVNKEFENRYGIKVEYTNYASNEDMYAKLLGGGANYDVIIPSDYMIERLIKEDLLEKLDFSNIPNYSYIPEEYKDLFFDPANEYSIPYTFGMVGLIYNTAMVDEEIDSWDVMWDEKYSGQILNFNNPRDAFGIAQYYLDIDINTENVEDWQRAAEKLKEQKPLIQSYVMDEIFNKMENGEAAIAPYYAGDFLTMADNNEDLAFVYPKEGTNVFVDSMCIPKGAQNKAAAELYINFMLETDIATANANFICYGCPHTGVQASDDYDLKGEEVLYPASVDFKTEYFHNLSPETLSLMTNLWDELKIDGANNTAVYIALVAVVVVVIVIAVVSIIRKKRRENDN